MANVLQTVRSDDFVEYFIFPVKDDDSCSTSEELVYLLNRILTFITPIVENYMWHKDKFSLRTNTDSELENCSSYLYGVLHYGENIDDEWFIVYVLKKISEQFDVFIRVIDSDGEFLLIESADHLPKCIESNNSDKRVYLHKNFVRILQPDVLLNNKSIDQIIKRLHQIEHVTDVERTVTKCIDERIQKFSNLEHFLHRSRVYVPAKVAVLLDAEPNLITAAVTAYCQRDVIDQRVCRKNEHFPPNDIVLRSVTFTKFSYAMISCEKFSLEKNNWNFPRPTDACYKEYQLGYKITCGFEILVSRSRKSQSDLTLNRKWNQYVQILKKKGYFKDLIENSKEYVELERKARSYFLNNVGIEESDHNDLLNILQTVNFDVDKMKREESELPPSDDEKWMEVNEEEFNKLLESRFGIKGVDISNTPEALSLAFNKFLNCTSSIDGIEIKTHKFACPISSSSSMDIDEESQHVSFNPEDFVPLVEKMLDFMESRNGAAVISSDDSNVSTDNSEDNETEDEDIDAPRDPTIKSYMDLMDRELQNSTLSKTFVPEYDEDSSELADTDMKAITDILKSYEEQHSESGPAGNLLHSMGLKPKMKKGH